MSCVSPRPTSCPRPRSTRSEESPGGLSVPHGTTVLALRYRDGVIMAGDRQASEGYQVASRRIDKIFKSDDLSGMGIAGAAGPAMEMARLFQTELEHYEKVEGENLSLDGKANKLGQMIRMNLPLAMQGLVVVPIFAGFDERAGVGRLFKYDVTGGPLRGDRLLRPGLGGQGRARLPQEALPARHVQGRGGAGGHRGAHGRGRRGPRHGRARPPARHLPDREDHHPLRLRRSRRTTRFAGTARPSSPSEADCNAAALLRIARADDEGQGGVCPQGHLPRQGHRGPRVP